MDFLSTTNEIIVLLTGLLGLIGTGIGTYFAIKNWFSVIKTKNSQEIWALIMEIADASMGEAEKAAKEGTITKESKKQVVIDSVKAGCKAAGLDVSLFLDQLNDYIDQTITFVNKMQKPAVKSASKTNKS